MTPREDAGAIGAVAREARRPGDAGREPLPATLNQFVLRFSLWHQVALSALSVLVFLLQTVPLEIQRRIVNDALKGQDYRSIVLLCMTYAGVAGGQGLLKLGMNVYRGWVGERAVRRLRLTIQALPRTRAEAGGGTQGLGVQTAVSLSEADLIGSFVGSYLSEPLLQGGLLASLFGYMVILQPWMALAALLVFVPQLVLVPIMQSAINRRVASRTLKLRHIGGLLASDVLDGEARGSRAQQRDVIDEIFVINMGVYKLKFSMNFVMNYCNHLGAVGVLATGGWFVVNGETEVGTIVAFLSGLGQLNDPWGDLVNWFRDLTVTGTRYRLVKDAVQRLAAGPGG